MGNPICPFCERTLKTIERSNIISSIPFFGLIMIRKGLNRLWYCEKCNCGWYKGKGIISKKTVLRIK